MTDLAVVCDDDDSVSVSPGHEGRAIWGATRSLAELNQQFDILGANDDWSGYQTLVLIDPLTLDEVRLQKVEAHLAAGGGILSAGSAGLLDDHKTFSDTNGAWTRLDRKSMILPFL